MRVRLSLLCLFASVCCLVARGADESPVRLTLSLNDGSTLVGTAGFTEIKLDASFDGVTVPLSLLSEIQLDTRSNARLTFRNGDRLSGTWDARRIAVTALIGTVEIAVTNITRISVTMPMPAGVGELIPDGRWRIETMRSGARGWASATVLHDGRVLLAGGSARSDEFLSSCDLFDPADESFRPTGQLRTPRHMHSATLLADGRVLVVGGYNRAQQWLADAELFDPASGQWTVTQPYAKHGVMHSTTRLPDGRILVYGGAIGNSQYTGAAEFFDPTTDRWIAARLQMEPRGGHTGTLLPDGRVLFVGGDDAQREMRPLVVFDPATSQSRPIGQLPSGRNQHCTFVLPDNRILIAGGESRSDRPERCFLFDLRSSSWSDVPSLASAQVWPAALQFAGGSAMLIGGSASAAHAVPVEKASLFDAGKAGWTALPKLNLARCGAPAVMLRDGRIAVFGGSDGRDGLNTYEIYSAPSDQRPPPKMERLRTTYPKPMFQ